MVSPSGASARWTEACKVPAMRFLTVTFFTCISLSFMSPILAQQIIPLYTDGIPNSKPTPDHEHRDVRPNGSEFITGTTIPTLTVFTPGKQSSSATAIIIVPGGGYHGTAIKHEGTDIARVLNDWGVTAFVLKYRIPSDATMINKEIGPLQDAQQAISIVRKGAKKWNINPDKIGIMGFSAGGHLASTAATHFSKSQIADSTVSLRPDFVMLGYPVISFSDSIGHRGSRNNLLGNSPSKQKIREYSNELQVTPQTPPTFLIHASDDKVVLPANSIHYYERLLKNKVPAELHIYTGGGHGFGMNNPTTTEKWMDSFRNWLVAQGMLEVAP